MTNEIVVRILAERIISGGLNPLRDRVMQLDDVVNVDYRKAVEDYILMHSEALGENKIEEVK
ncbi:hypothetical protein [Romboutsia maritimum]|nr:hypothetical protein [Romboutsia maritimum]